MFWEKINKNEKIHTYFNHKDLFNGKNNFCKNCSSLISKSYGSTIKLDKYSKDYKLKINPNHLYEDLICKSGNNWFYNENSLHLVFRNTIVNKIKKICNQWNYKTKTILLTIHYIDSIYSRHKLDFNYLDLVILICISFSSKINEKIEKSWSINCISNNFKNNINFNDLTRFEKIILNYLNFNLYMIIPFDFLEFFKFYGFVFEQEIWKLYKKLDHKWNQVEYYNFIINQLYDKVDELIYLSIDEYHLYQFTPLAIAVSCICLSRKLIGFSKWNKELEKYTYLKNYQIKKCYNIIKKLYMEKVEINDNKKSDLSLLKTISSLNNSDVEINHLIN